MNVDTWQLPDEHHPISLRAKARWERSGKLSAGDCAAIEAEYAALLEGDFDGLRDAAASLATLMFYLRGAGDVASADALHAIILIARPRFDRWRAERRQEGDDVTTAPAGVRTAPMVGEKAKAGALSLKSLHPAMGLDRARQAAERGSLRPQRAK